MTGNRKDNGADARASMLRDDKANDTVRAEMEREEAVKGQCPLIALGKTGGIKISVYYVREQREIVELNPKEHNGDMFEDIADLTRWGAWIDPGKSEELLENERRSLWRKVTKKLRSMSRKAGRYNPARERKIGLWREVVDGEKGVLCNSGAALHFMPSGGGALREVEGVQGENFYTRGKMLPPPAADMATDEEGEIIVEGFRSLTWAFSGAGEIVAGWLVCSLLVGFLKVRPSVWLTGAKGNGKTRAYKILSKLLGWKEDDNAEGYGLMMESLDSSAPGLWQSLESSLRPVLFDEVEGNGESNNEATLRKILAVIRNAATGAKAEITKGGKEGQAVGYKVSSSFLLCSIQARLDKGADRSRIVELPLVTPTASQKKAMAGKQAALEALADDPDFCGRLIHRVMKLAPVFEENRQRLRAYLAEKLGDYRQADIFSTLFVGCYLLRHDGLMSEDDMQHALIVVRSYVQTQDEVEDGEQCLAVLLNAVIYQGGLYGKMTTRQACEALASACTDPDKRAALEQALGVYGMRWLANNQDEGILEVLTGGESNPNLKDLFSKTRWADGKIAAVICPGNKPNAEGVTPGTRKGRGRTLRIPAHVVTPPEDGAEGEA